MIVLTSLIQEDTSREPDAVITDPNFKVMLFVSLIVYDTIIDYYRSRRSHLHPPPRFVAKFVLYKNIYFGIVVFMFYYNI